MGLLLVRLCIPSVQSRKTDSAWRPLPISLRHPDLFRLGATPAAKSVLSHGSRPLLCTFTTYLVMVPLLSCTKPSMNFLKKMNGFFCCVHQPGKILLVVIIIQSSEPASRSNC
uniref:Uncharacterized protein n=1 Tax=Triticum urartu TaxID=4572 RepID=A0A8R7UDK9_TRIUA